MNTTTRHYELLYIVDPNLTDDQIEPIIAKYSGIATEQGGEVQAAGKWDKRRLAYEVNGQREGNYILMYFTGEPSVAKELDRVMRISDDCFRHLITRVEPQHVDTTRIEQPSAPAEQPAEEAQAPVEAAAEEATAEAPAEETAAEEAPAAEAAPEAAPAEEEAAPAEEPAKEAEPAEAEEAQPEPAEAAEESAGEEPKAEE